jgi:hypothetical protein
MQENHPTLSALRNLHATLAGELLKNRDQADKLREDMKHVEAVIKLIDPSYNLRPIAIRRRKLNPFFKRGTVFRHAIDVLRTATAPLTAREITLAMLHSAGVSEPDPKAVRDLCGGVQASLVNNAGKVVEKVGEGMPARWKLIAA